MKGFGLPVQMLNGVTDYYLQPDGVYGIGCPDCGGLCLGAVNDYDTILVGGGTYSVNQIIGKNIIANRNTKLYSNPSGGGRIVGEVKTGEIIGKVQSYIKPSDRSSDGRSWLQFDRSYLESYYVPNEVTSGSGLEDQGTLTVKEEVKQEEIEKLKESSPVEYYIKKYASKVLLIGGGIILVAVLGKELIRVGLTKAKNEEAKTPALAGTKRSRRKSKKTQH